MGKSVLQTEAWADLKKSQGWSGDEVMGVLVLKKQLPAGYNFLYAPEVVQEEGEGFSLLISRAMGALSHCKNDRTIFGRLELLVEHDPVKHNVLLAAGYIKSGDEVQPEHRQEIDISHSMDSVLAQMKQKCRYNINLAKRHGVLVEMNNDPKAVQMFADISHLTAARKHFEGRGHQYYQQLVKTLAENGMGGLYLATYQGKVLAGAIITFYGERASYLYGASAAENREVMAPFLIHNTVIEDAKKRGCTIYDLIGIAPPDAGPEHHWAGITRFKKEFGGRSVKYLGSYDCVYKPLIYQLYKLKRK